MRARRRHAGATPAPMLLNQPSRVAGGQRSAYPCGVGGVEAIAGGVAGIAARSVLLAEVST